MNRTFCVLVAVVVVGLHAAPGEAQTASTPQMTQGDVTFRVPLNLTQLSYDISKVAVTCTLMKDSWSSNDPDVASASKQEELGVAGGQLVSTAIVTVRAAFLSGRSLNHRCELKGYSTSLQRWSEFSNTATDLVFRLTPNPQKVNGQLVW